MASNNVLFDQQQMACSICLDQFQTPKALACLHTFCQECIQCYINTNINRQNRTFPCPMCRRVCQLDPATKNASKIPVKDIAKHLPTNFHLLNLQESQLQKRVAAEPQDVLSRNYLDKIEDLEKKIADTKRVLEKEYRFSMFSVQVFRQGVQFCPSDDEGCLNLEMESFQKKVRDHSQQKQDILDTFLAELEGIRTDIINHILPDNHGGGGDKRKRRGKKNRAKSVAGGFDAIKTNLSTCEKKVKASFEEMNLDNSRDDLKDIMDRMQSLWCRSLNNPQEVNTTKSPLLLFMKVPKNQEHYLSIGDHFFPNLDKFVFICSVKLMTDDTVVVCGKSPNLLLGYDANTGMLTSRMELSAEPTNMSVLNDLDVMVTFASKTDIEIITVSGPKPRIRKILDIDILYSQAICLRADNDGTTGAHKILALAAQRYDVISFDDTSAHFEVVSTGRVPVHYPDSRFVYIKQKDVIVYSDITRKTLLGYSLSLKKMAFKYSGDTENPLVVISDICCDGSFIYVADRRHHKIHKLNLHGSRQDIIECHGFHIMWPLHIDVNSQRTMVICSQKRKTLSYSLKTFLC